MKRLFSLVLLFLLFTGLLGCTSVSIPNSGKATLRFQYETTEKTYDIEKELTAEETAVISEIFDGKPISDVFSSGVPSCGSDSNISIQIGATTYAIACDGCGTIFIVGTFNYFDISQQEISAIHNIFEKYGGFFPCI